MVEAIFGGTLKAMYLISWNENEGQLEASIGGHVTEAEAKVFVDGVMHELADHTGGPFTFLLDYSFVTEINQGITDCFDLAVRYANLRGAVKTVHIAKDREQVETLTGENLQRVLEGTLEFRLAC